MKIKRTRNINVTVTGTTGSFQFPDQPDLRNAFIQGIEIFTINDISQPTAATGTIMPLADMKLCSFTLYEGDLQICFKDPILEFHRMQNASNDPFVRQLQEFDNAVISWTKCTIDTAGALSGANVVVPVRIHFVRKQDLDMFAQRSAGIYALEQKTLDKALSGQVDYLANQSAGS